MILQKYITGSRKSLTFATYALNKNKPLFQAKKVINVPLAKYLSSQNDAVVLSSQEFTTNNTDNNLSPVLILHGFLGSKMNWRSLASALAQKTKRKIYTLDTRNHGDSPHTSETSYSSMVADVLLFAKNNNIDKAILMGHSLGGKTVMLTALQSPNTVEKLIVVDVAPVTYKGVGISGTQLILTAMKNATNELKGDENLSQARRLVDKILSKTIEPLGLRQFVLTNLVEKSGKVVWKVNYDLLYKDYHKLMHYPEVDGQFNNDTLFVIGANSDYVSKETYPVIKKYFPQSVIENIPDAGHWVHADKPNEFLNIVIPFLNK